MLDEDGPHFQGYGMDVACDMATMRIVVLFRYVDEISRYFLEGELMQAVNQNQHSALVQSASKSAAECVCARQAHGCSVARRLAMLALACM